MSDNVIPIRPNVRMSLDLSAEVNDRLEALAAKMDGSKASAIRRAIALMEVAVEARAKGAKVLVVETGKPPTEIVWL